MAFSRTIYQILQLSPYYSGIFAPYWRDQVCPCDLIRSKLWENKWPQLLLWISFGSKGAVSSLWPVNHVLKWQDGWDMSSASWVTAVGGALCSLTMHTQDRWDINHISLNCEADCYHSKPSPTLTDIHEIPYSRAANCKIQNQILWAFTSPSKCYWSLWLLLLLLLLLCRLRNWGEGAMSNVSKI